MRAMGPLRRPSGVESGRIRLLVPHPGQNILCFQARRDRVDRCGLQIGVAQDGRGRRKRHAGDCRDAEAVAETLREGLGPSRPASTMILVIFRWAVARDQSRRGIAGSLHRPSSAAGVDELEIADQARHFTWRSVSPVPSARLRLGLLQHEKTLRWRSAGLLRRAGNEQYVDSAHFRHASVLKHCGDNWWENGQTGSFAWMCKAPSLARHIKPISRTTSRPLAAMTVALHASFADIPCTEKSASEMKV